MAVRVLPGVPLSPIERLADDYLIHCRARGLSPRTIENSYAYALQSVFLPWCAAEDIHDVKQLNQRTVDRFTASLLERRRADGKPISSHSVHTWVRPVRQMLTWASKNGEDVQAKPQLPRRSKPIRDVLTREEIDRLEQVVPAERDKLIIRIFGDCGLRLDELTQLRPDDIVRSGRQAFLRVLGKGQRYRDVPLSPITLRRLERLVAGRSMDRSEDRIFLSLRRGPLGYYEPLTRSGVYLVVKDAVARAGLKKRVHPHLLRHSWMTEMIRSGVHPVQLSVVAGASIEVINQHYAHLTQEDAYDSVIRALVARRT
jgi:integrase/recombinase XerD